VTGAHAGPAPRRAVALIVDDDADFLAFMRAGLRQFGHEAIVARSAADARSKLAAHPEVVLIVMDGLLPDGNGMDLIEELRRWGYLGRFVFVSAFFRDQRAKERLAASGVVDVLSKRSLDPLATFKSLHFAIEDEQKKRS
jgi:CheY-like chemotaxis protein